MEARLELAASLFKLKLCDFGLISAGLSSSALVLSCVFSDTARRTLGDSAGGISTRCPNTYMIFGLSGLLFFAATVVVAPTAAVVVALSNPPFLIALPCRHVGILRPLGLTSPCEYRLLPMASNCSLVSC